VNVKVSVKGLSGLAKLSQNLLAAADSKAELEREFADEAGAKVRASVAGGRSPYGGSWQSGGSGLKKLASLVRVDGTFLVIAHPWASSHQYGATMTGNMRFKGRKGWARRQTVTVPARPMIPTDGLPTRWKSSFQARATAVIRKKMGV
jgi:hypothetical protein